MIIKIIHIINEIFYISNFYWWDQNRKKSQSNSLLQENIHKIQLNVQSKKENLILTMKPIVFNVIRLIVVYVWQLAFDDIFKIVAINIWYLFTIYHSNFESTNNKKPNYTISTTKKSVKLYDDKTNEQLKTEKKWNK